MEGKGRDRWKLYENLKLGDYLLIKFKKLSTFMDNSGLFLQLDF